MPKMNLLVHLNAYSDSNDTNNPSRNNVKWNREIQGIEVSEPTSKSLELNSDQSQTLFSGVENISSDATTTWDIALKSGSSNVYRISHNSGTSPDFRTNRSIGHDATTEVTVTKNATLLTFKATGGTVFDLNSAGVQVGDEVRIGDQFSNANQGKYKIISFGVDYFVIENQNGAAEGPITLGSGYEEQISIFSADGVQVGSKIDIVDGFSPVTFGTYEIVDVSPDYIEIYSNNALPGEQNISNDPEAFMIYSSAKKFLYIESNKKLDIKINDSTVTNAIEPIVVGKNTFPGVFMSSDAIKKAEIVNKSQETANVFYVTAE